jgi:hypothetical protein
MLQAFELIIIVAVAGIIVVALSFGTLTILSKLSGKKK